jgi:hypothetical protein
VVVDLAIDAGGGWIPKPLQPQAKSSAWKQPRRDRIRCMVEYAGGGVVWSVMVLDDDVVVVVIDSLIRGGAAHLLQRIKKRMRRRSTTESIK